MTIVATQSVASFFSEAVTESIRSRGLDATESATRYLVAVLADFARPQRSTGGDLNRPLTLLYGDAVGALDPAERFERLRSLGDGILYGCGFFSDHFDSKGIDRRYLHAVGARAYSSAGGLLRRGTTDAGPDLFGELSAKFAAFAQIFSDVADASIATGAETARGLVRVYERWLRTGSSSLAGALTARGLVPTRVPKGPPQ